MKTNKHMYAVILAGGRGTRFWPVSRGNKPKQFLNITGRGTLLQETLSRISPLVRGSHVFIVTNAAYRKEIERQVKRFRIPKANILLEPSGKNTAPAICWAAAKIHRLNYNAVMAVLPSDHLIQNKKKFLSALRQAVTLANKDHLVTLGIPPTRPETGYGYLKTAKKKVKGKSVYKVDRFTEKPNLAKAKKFIKRKGYFWNSGMFVWKTDAILNEFQKHLPNIYKPIVGAGFPRRSKFLSGRGSDRAKRALEKPARTFDNNVRKVWSRLPNISIDYGILEKAWNVVAVPAPVIGWSDLGSWESLAEVLPKNKEGNIFKGDVVPFHCRDSIVFADKRIVAPVGLENMIVIDTPDALLICPKDLSQDVRHIVALLQKQKRPEI